MLKELIKSRNKKKKKYLQNEPQTIKKMAIGSYIPIINLNANGLNAPTERYRLTEWIKIKTHIHAVYRKSTSDLKTHID